MTKEIPLTQNKVALVDDEDYEYLSQFKWCATKVKTKSSTSFYAIRTTGRGVSLVRYLMHRVIMNTPDDLVVDHINHNTLDNRKENLRNCTPQQNQHNAGMFSTNTSGYKGVVYRKPQNCYEARIRVNNKRIYLGWYKTPEEASEAYKNACTKYYGEYANKDLP